jgi:hypothetical protein
MERLGKTDIEGKAAMGSGERAGDANEFQSIADPHPS